MEINIEVLIEILRNSVSDIHNLDEYYNNQLGSVIEHTKKEFPKYYSGIVLDKFFYSKINKEARIEISEKEQKIVDSIIEKYEVIDEKDKKIVSYVYKNGISEEKKIDPTYAKNKGIALLNQKNILGESLLIMLLASYEITIASIFKVLIYKSPQIYINEKSLTYSEILGFNSDLDEIKRLLIERETDEFMRKAIKDWYDHFKTKYKVDVLSSCDVFDEFREIYYRRNIIVHNQGIINEVYAKEIGNNNKIGERVSVNKKYFENAISKTLIMIYQTIWCIKKVFNDDDIDLANFMYEQGYEYMVKKRWDVSSYIFKTILNSNSASEYDKMCWQVNYWVSIKNSIGLDSIIDDINNKDVTALDRTFIAAKYALLDDFKNLNDILEELINNSIPANYIKEWPLFLQYRKTDLYKNFVKNHVNEFNEARFDSNSENVNGNEDIMNELEENIIEIE